MELTAGEKILNEYDAEYWAICEEVMSAGGSLAEVVRLFREGYPKVYRRVQRVNRREHCERVLERVAELLVHEMPERREELLAGETPARREKLLRLAQGR